MTNLYKNNSFLVSAFKRVKIYLCLTGFVLIAFSYTPAYSSYGDLSELEKAIQEIITMSATVSGLVGTPADLGNLSLSLINLKNQIKQMKDAAEMFSGKNALKTILGLGGDLYRKCGGKTYSFPLLFNAKAYTLDFSCPFTDKNIDSTTEAANHMFGEIKNYDNAAASKKLRGSLRVEEKRLIYSLVRVYKTQKVLEANEIVKNPDNGYRKRLENILEDPNLVNLVALQTAISIKLLEEQEVTNQLLSSLLNLEVLQ